MSPTRPRQPLKAARVLLHRFSSKFGNGTRTNFGPPAKNLTHSGEVAAVGGSEFETSYQNKALPPPLLRDRYRPCQVC